MSRSITNRGETMEKLREEIIESEKARTDFLKWKLIGVAALGATGLGLTEHVDSNAYLILALIPPVCFYVDLLCRHFSLRILVIGRFLGMQAGDQGPYERFVERSRSMGRWRLSAFALEDMALDGSTVILSILIIAAGYVRLRPPPPETLVFKFLGWYIPSGELARDMFILSGAGVIVLTFVVRLIYWRRDSQLKLLAGVGNRPNPPEEHAA